MIEIGIGLIAGIISGTGMGGGTILILLLTILLGKEQHMAQAANLVFFIPTAIAAIIINGKQKLVDWKLGSIIGVIGSIGAIFGALIASRIDSSRLKKYFGIFLAIIAIHEIYSLIKSYRSKKKGHTMNKLEEYKGGK